MNNKAWQKKGATNNKAMKQQWGGGWQEVLKKEGEHQGATSSKVRW